MTESLMLGLKAPFLSRELERTRSLFGGPTPKLRKPRLAKKLSSPTRCYIFYPSGRVAFRRSSYFRSEFRVKMWATVCAAVGSTIARSLSDRQSSQAIQKRVFVG